MYQRKYTTTIRAFNKKWMIYWHFFLSVPVCSSIIFRSALFNSFLLRRKNAKKKIKRKWNKIIIIQKERRERQFINLLEILMVLKKNGFLFCRIMKKGYKNFVEVYGRERKMCYKFEVLAGFYLIKSC